MSIILAADTSTSVCTVAVCRFDDGPEARKTILAETVVESGRLHAERLVGMVDWTLAAANIPLPEIDVLAVGIGPGSFTGLRIGVATLKGLALGASLGLVGVSSLDALASLAPVQEGTVAVFLDARMNEVFGALYHVDDGKTRRLTQERACPIEDFLTEANDAAYFLGDGAALYAKNIRAAIPKAKIDNGMHSAPRASAIADVANSMLRDGDTADAASIAPVYIRASQAEVNRDRKLQEKMKSHTTAESIPDGDMKQ